MSNKSSAYSNSSELETRASFLDLSQISQRIQGSSTPIPEHVHEAVVPPSDVSDVISYGTSSSSNIHRKCGRLRKSECRVPLEESSSSRSYGRSISRPRSASNPTPKKSHLEKIVAERLVMPSVRRSLSTAFAELNVDNEQSNDRSSLTGTEPPAKKYKSAHKGHDWETFKSKHKDRIFSHVLNKPDDTLEEAKIWLQLYKKNASKGIITLIQFFADVCGYQDLDVSSIFKYDEENYKTLRDYMQDKPPKYQKDTGKYLMKITSNWGKQSQDAIYAFIQDLLETVYNSETLFDKVMLKHMFGIVMSLLYSTNRSMYHTGVVIVAKIYTSFLEIHVSIQKKLETYRSESKCSTQQVNTLVKHERLIFEILKKVQNIIEYNCCIQDPQLDKMEVTVIEEMFNWFKIYPSLLSSTKYFKILMTFVEDQSNKVRSAALEVCHKLVKDKSMVNYMKPFIKTVTVVVEGRIRDVDYGISTDAAYICKDILLEYPNAIPVAARDRLLMLVYCENHQLALAAGSFLHQTLCTFCVENEEVNSAKFIKFLIKFSYLETEEHVPLLVEALLPHSAQLLDWNTVIDLLLTGDLESKDERILINIMSHAVQQSITAKSKIARAKTIAGRPKIKNIRETWGIFLTNLYALLKKFSSHPKSVQMLCEILLVIDCSDRSLGKYLKDVISIIKVLQAIFVKNSDRELLITVSKALTDLGADLSVFKNRAIILVDMLHQSVITALVNSIEHLSQTESPSEDEVKIEATSLKLSVLLMHQDLAGLIEQHYRDWLTLEEIITSVAMKNLITCGHWYMIWTLRKLISDGIQPQPSENLEESTKQLKSNTNEYIKACFNFIRRSKDFSICTEAFECICKVHMTFKQELKNPMKINQVLKELLLDEPDNDQLTLLITFAEHLIFEEKNESTLNTRRICLGHILQLAYLHVIPFPELAKVYVHYHLHKDDYGDVFDNGLKVQKSNGLAKSAIILPTLTHCYTNTDLTQNESRDQLRKLAKEFQIFLSRSGHDLKLILQMGITYSVYSESRYTFLYYLKYFIKTLSPTDRKLILEFFLSKIPRGDEDHQVFIDFKRDLQNKQTTESVQQRRLTTTTTSSYMSDTEDIEYDTESKTSSYVESYSIDDLSDAI